MAYGRWRLLFLLCSSLIAIAAAKSYYNILQVQVAFLVILVFGGCYCGIEVSTTITYDHKAIIIDGKRRVLQSGSIHYPRATHEMWPNIIRKAKEGGLDVIESYVFWNYHEPVRGQYYFQGRFDLVKFVNTVQEVDLFVHLRIGPYACAEWNYGAKLPLLVDWIGSTACSRCPFLCYTRVHS